MNNEIDENSLAFAKGIKKYLRFDLGDTVYLKSDIKKKCPMTICNINTFDNYNDYEVSWTTSQKNIENGSFKDKTLMH